ncbi:MAG: PKD domain-containing protein [Candidatus Woesearchaeota archaeon]|nr:PKD domain-containing protein [Candidatus Woesearchaeota archaeon]
MRARDNSWIFGILALALLIFPVAAFGEFSPLNISISHPIEGDSFYSHEINLSFSFNETGNFSCAAQIYCNNSINSYSSFTADALQQNSVVLQAENCSYASYEANISCSNENYSGSSETVMFYIFETPIITLINPDDSAIINLSEENFGYSIDPGSESLIKNCSLYIDENESAVSFLVHNGTNYFDYNISEGYHSWKISCILIGSAGETIESEERELFVDYSAPFLILLSPILPAYDRQEIPLIVNATDAFSQVLSCTALGLPTLSSFEIQNSSVYESNLSVPPGNYAFNITCFDIANNSASISGSFERINFSVSTDNTTYLPNQNVFITVNAPQSSRVNLTVSNANTSVSSLTSPPYPITYVFASTSKLGNYSILAILSYDNVTFYRNASFAVSNPNNLSVSIDSNASVAEAGVPIRFSSNVSGNINAVSYAWDFNSDGITDSISPNPIYAYTLPGTYHAALTVNDSYSAASAGKNITVLGRFSITVIAKDTLGAPLIANITLGNTSIISNSTGAAVFQNVLEGTYALNATADGYYPYSNTAAISANQNITIYLSSLPLIPIVQISFPQDGSQLSLSSIDFTFKVLHNYTTNCTLYSNEGGNWWAALSNISEVQKGIDYSIAAENLTTGNYTFKIVCKDRFGNSGSGQVSLSANIIAAPAEPSYPELDSAEQALSDKQAYYDSIGPVQLEAANLLGISGALSDAQNRLSRARRDLSDLVYSRQTPEQIEARKNQIISDAVAHVDSIPYSIDVLSSSEFVKYPKESELLNIASAFISAKGLNVDQRTFLRANSGLQQLFSIDTKAFRVVLHYNSSEQEVSIVSHAITLNSSISNNDSVLSNLALVLYIPKNITDSASKVNFTGNLENSNVLRDDPIIELPVIENITYAIGGSFDVQNANSISISLVQKSATVSIPGITGFAVSERTAIWPFNYFSGKLGSSLGLQIFLLLLLITVYVGYTVKPEIITKPVAAIKGAISGKMGTLRAERYPPTQKLHPAAYSELQKPAGESQMSYTSPLIYGNAANQQPYYSLGAIAQQQKLPAALGMQYSYAASSVQRARHFIEENNYDDAASAYYELRLIYGTMPDNIRAMLYPQMITLFHQLNLCYVKGLLYSAKSLIASEDYKSAALIYEKIEKAYRILPKELKYHVFMDCFDVITKLERNKEMLSENQKAPLKKTRISGKGKRGRLKFRRK